MSIERNIIFLYPLSSKIKELKDEMEKDENLMVYELDSVNEYGQIVGVLEHSVTFSSDLKKTQAYLQECKQFTRVKTAKNFLVQDKSIPPHVFSKMQKLGLNEVLKEDSHLKSLIHKVDMFFRPFEDKLRKEEEEKNKALPGVLKMNKPTTIGEKKSQSGNEVQRVEKMALMDEPEKEKKKRKHSGFDADFLLGGSLNSNFELKKNNTDDQFLNSNFDNIQRKKLATFDPVENKPKLKNGNFTPVVEELKNNPQKQLQVKPPGELNKKSASNIEFQDPEYEKKEVEFKEQEEQLQKKRKKFEEQLADLKKKSIDFEEVLNDIERKKVEQIDNEESEKKRKYFEEVAIELEQKKKEVEEVEEELNKKRKTFDEVEADYNKKRKHFEESDLPLQEKKKALEELFEQGKKKNKLFEEQEELAKKKKKLFEETEAIKNVKEHSFEEIDLEQAKKNNFNEVEGDLNKKKGLDLDIDELEKKKLKFEEVAIEKPERTKFNEVDLDDKSKKRGDISDLEIERRKLKDLGLVDSENKKLGTFTEVEIEKKKKKNVDLGEPANRERPIAQRLDLESNKEFDEQTLDYSKFKKDRHTGEFTSEDDEAELKEKKTTEDILAEEEYIFYKNRSYGLEYLVIYNDFLLNSKMSADNLYKFIHFALIKDYHGVLSVILLDPRVEDIKQAGVSGIKLVYNGHDQNVGEYVPSEFMTYLDESIDRLLACNIPTWKDETFQIEMNEFIYPFYEEGKLLGYAICHLKDSVKSHNDATKIELLVMSLKGVVMQNIKTIGSSS